MLNAVAQVSAGLEVFKLLEVYKKMYLPGIQKLNKNKQKT